MPSPAVPPNLKFGSSPLLLHSFRNRTLSEGSTGRVRPLKAEARDEPVVGLGDGVWWAHRKEGAADLHLVGGTLPDLPEGAFLFQYLQSDCWAELLPLLTFFRGVAGWEPPPPRACLMFDDPNLHWRSYGYINFASLARHAREHRYHASFAMVPLDAWHLHRSTARLFQENGDLLSLLVHGNNHARNELALPYSEQRRSALVAQALTRVERFEQQSGLEVSRVMAAPHHACSDEMAGTLARMGFEAACVSPAFIMEHNRARAWPEAAGLAPADFLAGSLPVIPRFTFGLINLPRILLAGFFGQAIVPVGHHDDLADGLGVLRKLADSINQTGEVGWTDMTSIARSNFWSRRDGSTMHLRLYSRQVRFTVPEGVTAIHIERPWLKADQPEPLTWREDLSPVQLTPACPSEPIPTTPGVVMDIRSVLPNALDHHKAPFTRTPVWAIMRRQLCEGRDRLKPAVHRIRRFANLKSNLAAHGPEPK
ncbi:MAG TPA: hypothetical protein VG146_13910 [Verrucomicrobiae bacterium]|nr:hypothetical protein [Verrucomicrobiae bacterium]